MSRTRLIMMAVILAPLQLDAQAVGGRGGSGFDKAAQAYSCQEGRRQWFTESAPGRSDQQVSVLRTCRNGSYYDLSDYIYNPQARCKEGLVQMVHGVGRNEADVIYQCVGGKWRPLFSRE